MTKKRQTHRTLLASILVIVVAALPWFLVTDSRGSGGGGWLKERTPAITQLVVNGVSGYAWQTLPTPTPKTVKPALVKSGSQKPAPHASCPNLQNLSRAEMRLFISQYQTTSAEIQRRLDQDYLLFALKLGATGAMLGLILTVYSMMGSGIAAGTGAHLRRVIMSEGAALCCWAAVCTCAIIDVRAQYGIRVIVDLGDWIRTYVDPCMSLGGYAQGWEDYWLANGIPHGQPLSLSWGLERRLLTLFLYDVSVFVFVWRPLHTRDEVADAAALISLSTLSVPVSIVLMGLSQLYSTYEGDLGYWICGYVATIAVIALLAMLFIRWAKRRQIPKTNLDEAKTD